MNKFTILFLILLFPSYPTEERNPNPFFRVSGKKLEIILENLNASVCLINSPDVFEYSLATQEKCEDLKQNVWTSIEKIVKEKTKKKEFIFLFYDKNNLKMKAGFFDEKVTYDLISMIYYKQEKTFYLELMDLEKNYYFFQVNPKNLKFKIKIQQ